MQSKQTTTLQNITNKRAPVAGSTSNDYQPDKSEKTQHERQKQNLLLCVANHTNLYGFGVSGLPGADLAVGGFLHGALGVAGLSGGGEAKHGKNTHLQIKTPFLKKTPFLTIITSQDAISQNKHFSKRHISQDATFLKTNTSQDAILKTPYLKTNISQDAISQDANSQDTVSQDKHFSRRHISRHHFSRQTLPNITQDTISPCYLMLPHTAAVDLPSDSSVRR